MTVVTEKSARKPGDAAAWWMVAVLFLIYVLAWLDRLVISMLVEPIKADMALSDFQMSIILGPAFAISYAIFGLPLGWAADRFSRRTVIFFGVLTWAFATVACGFARTFETLLLARIVVGIGEAALLPSAYSLISDGFPREKLTLATSTFQMAGKVGSATAFGLGGIAIAFAVGLKGVDLPIHGPAEPWQIVMMLVGLPGFLFAFMLFSFREPLRRDLGRADPQARSVAATTDFVRANWQLVGLMLTAFSALAICGYSMTAWVPTFIGREYGWEPVVYGPALSLMNLLAAASLVVNGKIVDTLFSRGMKDVHLRFYSWLILALTPAILYMFFAPNPWVFLVLYGIVQFITVPFMVYLSSVVALLAPNAVRGQIIAFFMFVFTMLGMGAGPAVVGGLTDFVFASEDRLGDSLAIVVIAGAGIAFAALRLSLRYLGPAIIRREALAADSVRG
ncbi:MFS transporter [uncultured Sphingosinicella sp.]|jgi:MFS family permease|uniref:MFS transporter n=1 Tax=uncultured Sphingosinicella sp. TaxID=478748 RepID=UPI0030DD667D|tara:strand:- start:10491 stop:11840 length:1350 start_codon:yes stop_codon:yes gene_type:complete